MTIEEIKQQIGQSESAELEYKSAKGGFPDSFWETFSAFANTNGGIIVLGVKEKEGKLIPDGLDEQQLAKYKKAFWDGAHNKGKVSATMLTESDVKEIDVNGNSVLVFHIPRAAYDLRPVFLNKNPFGNTFRRNHEGDYHCTDQEVRLMIADAESQGHSFDSFILPNYTIDDIDIPTLRAYRQRFMLRHDNHPWNNIDDMTFLTKIGAYRIDRKDGNEGFTRAGILMLGKSESITDQICAPWYFVDYQEKLSEDANVRWTDRIYPDGTWEANLYQFFFRVYGKLTQLLPTPFMLKGIQRQEETSAHIALREALCNMLVHCKFAEKGSILVVATRNSIVMRNPGGMLISLADFYAGSRSICRNPTLQKFFLFLGYGEKAGSGADIIRKGWEDNGWEMPVISERVQPEETEIRFQIGDSPNTELDTTPKTTQKGQDTTQKNQDTTQKTTQKGQDTTQKILEEIKKNPSISRDELAEKCGLTSDGIKYNIRKLREKGIIKRIGPDKGGHWEIIE